MKARPLLLLLPLLAAVATAAAAAQPALRPLSVRALARPAFSFNPDPFTDTANDWWLQAETPWPRDGAPATLVGVDAVAAWPRSTGRGVIVAVLDTGIDASAPELAGRLWTNPGEIPGNGIDDDHDGIVDDVHGAEFTGGTPSADIGDRSAVGHGSRVAGLVAQAAPDVRLMPLRISADGETMRYSAEVAAIRYAVAHGARIISISWGSASDCRRSLGPVIESAAAQGVLVVVAAGNSSEELRSASNNCPTLGSPGVVGVAASDGVGLAWFSNFGFGVQLAAPGYEVVSTAPQGEYDAGSGTSFAAPLVAGVAALLLADRPQAKPAQLVQALIAGSRPVPSLVGKILAGGTVDAVGALDQLERLDLTPPSAPAPLTPAGSFRLRRRKQVSFRWSRASDNVAVVGYRLYLDGRLRLQLPAAATSATCVLPRGRHAWAVVAYDADGNASS